jgi:hypothetical protein
MLAGIFARSGMYIRQAGWYRTGFLPEEQILADWGLKNEH